MNAEQEKIMELVEEMEVEAKKRQYVPVYYKRNGQMRRRFYDDAIDTPRYKELFYGNGGIRGVRVFKCRECRCMVDYFGFEAWMCDFWSGKFLCSCCYEESMGDDL